MNDRQLIALALLVLFCGPIAGLRVEAQPQISYIIPDIGAPGMNTYVEIVAPVDRIGSFNPGLSEGTGVMPLTALEIELVNPFDSNRVVISPGVVSWDGRLVGCQFFVHPNATPGPVPIRLRVNSSRSNVDTFFIVTPQTLPSGATGSAVLGSGGAWGRRSKRGAMIVESLNLGAGSFTVDRTDTDPGTPGNQGLLPAVIISRTGVTLGAGSRFHVDANGKDGGPGGGGGGGYGNRTGFPPVQGERNTPLGSGYTGGSSSTPFPANASSFGTGSGAGSTSLNGVSANNRFTTTFPTFARLFGAGPGHPFDRDGRSGGAAAVASGGATIFGTYYSGGGNATKGSGAPANQDDVNGQVVGNRQIVPLHGGGGGSSGGANDSVGAGGGGGLALYSQGRTILSTVAAAGADGADGCHNCGLGSGDGAAGGAGGSIIIGGKSVVSVTTVDVKGGAAGAKGPGAVTGSSSGNGGAGRFRFDGRLESGIPTVSNGASVYTGPTIDTLSFVDSPTFRLQGTARFDATGLNTVHVYLRSENDRWDIGPSYTSVPVRDDSTWSVDVIIPFRDTIFYVFAVQVIQSTEREGTDSATRIPSVVFSQAAANVIRYIPRPELVLSPQEKSDTILCDDGAYYYDTILVRNRGAGTLTIEQGGIGLDNPAGSTIGFTLLSNPAAVAPYVMAPGKIDTLVIRYDPRAFLGSPVSVVLSVRSDDPVEPVRTHRLNVLLAYDLWYGTAPSVPGPIDFGTRLVGTSATDTAVLFNTGFRSGTEIIVDSIWVTDPSSGVTFASRNVPASDPINEGDSLVIGLRYYPTSIDVLADVYLCARTSSPCSDTICWLVQGRGVASVLTLSRPSFSLVTPPCWGGSVLYDTIWIGNDGNEPFNLLDIVLPGGGDFSLVEPVTFPVTVTSGAPVPVVISFIPTTPGSSSAALLVATDIPGTGSLTIEINGSSDLSELTASAVDSVLLETYCLETSTDSLLTYLNSGTVIDTVSLRLASGTLFSLSETTKILQPGDSLGTLLSFSPVAEGRFVDTLFVLSEPCGIRDTLLLIGEMAAPDYQIVPDPLLLGSVPVGGQKQVSAVINNAGGSVPIRILTARFFPPDAELEVTNTSFPMTIPAGDDTQRIGITWEPKSVRQLPAGTALEVIIDSPCPDTILVGIEGYSTEGGLSVRPNPLDFGATLNCQAAVDTVWVENFSETTPARILEWWLDTPAPNYSVTLIDPTDPTPTIDPLDSVGLIVSFRPLVGPDGPQSTTLRIRTNNPNFDTLSVDVRGVRFSEALSISGPGFGTVFPNGSDIQTFTVTNSGTSPVAINSFVIPSPFRRVVVRPQLPALLVAGASLEIDIEFAPSDTGTYVDSILVDGIVQCDTIRLPISAVASEPELVRARWGSLSGEPGDLIMLPLEILDDVTGLGITRMRVDVNHDRTMLFAEDAEFAEGIAPGWKVDRFTRIPGGARLEISGPTPLSGSGTLLSLRTRVLLGENLTTFIRSTDSSRLVSGTGMLSIDSGEFALEGYCAIGSNRLVRISGDFGIKSVVPQPTDGQLRVEYETVEDGPTRLRIVDILGRQVALLTDGYQNRAVHESRLDERLPAGTYMILLETRTDRDVRMIVVK